MPACVETGCRCAWKPLVSRAEGAWVKRGSCARCARAHITERLVSPLRGYLMSTCDRPGKAGPSSSVMLGRRGNRQVDGDALRHGEAVEHAFERHLAPDPALLHAAVGLAKRLAASLVHLNPPRLDSVGGPQRLPDVARPDVGGKAIMAVVCHPDRICFVLPGNGDQNRTEDLLAREPPRVRSVRKDRRHGKVPFAERAVTRGQSSHDEARLGAGASAHPSARRAATPGPEATRW